MKIFADDDVIARNQPIAARMSELAAQIGEHPAVADVRQAGMIVAFELTRGGDKRTPFASAARVGLKAYRAALDKVVLRPLGDVLYWMPPYCVDEAQLALLADTTRHAIAEAVACA